MCGWLCLCVCGHVCVRVFIRIAFVQKRNLFPSSLALCLRCVAVCLATRLLREREKETHTQHTKLSHSRGIPTVLPFQSSMMQRKGAALEIVHTLSFSQLTHTMTRQICIATRCPYTHTQPPGGESVYEMKERKGHR